MPLCIQAYSVTTILRDAGWFHALECLPISAKANTLSIGSFNLPIRLRPDVGAHRAEDVADFLSERVRKVSDVVNAARGNGDEIEIAMRAAETADIDDAAITWSPSSSGWRRSGNLVDDQVDTSPPVASAPDRPSGIFESIARSAPKSFNRPRRAASVEEPITIVAP